MYCYVNDLDAYKTSLSYSFISHLSSRTTLNLYFITIEYDSMIYFNLVITCDHHFSKFRRSHFIAIKKINFIILFI